MAGTHDEIHQVEVETLMKQISESVSNQLKWEQPQAFKMVYELKDGADLLATLRFRSSFGSFATGECAGGCWTFKRVGFFKTRVTVRVCGSDVEIGTFQNNTWSGGGSLELPGGRKLSANTNFWQTDYEFTTEAGEALVHYKHGGVLHMSALVEIRPAAVTLPELPWLVILGWYLVILLSNDSGAAA